MKKILNTFKQHKLNMDETIIVSTIIDKLPPSWKDVKKGLKYRKDDVALEGLANHLRLEEQYRSHDENKEDDGSKVYMVEANYVKDETNHDQVKQPHQGKRVRYENEPKANNFA